MHILIYELETEQQSFFHPLQCEDVLMSSVASSQITLVRQ